VKLWNVGVPPSGPMDAYAFRVANALVGNTASAAGLEFAIQGALHPMCTGAQHACWVSEGLHQQLSEGSFFEDNDTLLQGRR
jgi:Carboxyltransferase domain, subdomain A and B